MTKSSRWASAALAGLLVPAALFAQNPPKFIGDDGALSPGKARNSTSGDGTGTSSAGSAMNLNVGNRQRIATDDRRNTPIVYERYRRQGGPDSPLIIPLTKETVTIGYTPGTNPQSVIPTAAQWLAFLRDRVPNSNDVDYDGRPDSSQPQPVVRISADPPRQTILVVDQGFRHKEILAGRQPEVIVWKTQTIVNRWTEIIPQYRNDTVVAYPCCCNVTFSVLTGYRSIEHVQTTYQQVPEAEYRTIPIAVDRGVVLAAGNPQYTTQIPQLCEFHYGPGAVYKAPVVPLIADINDRPAGGSTDTTSGTATTTLNTMTNSQNYNQIIDAWDRVLATSSTQTIQTNTSQTVVIPVGTRPLIPGTAPSGANYGGIVLNQNELSRNLEVPSTDRGTATHPNDKAYVVSGTSTDGSDQPQSDPYKYKLK